MSGSRAHRVLVLVAEALDSELRSLCDKHALEVLVPRRPQLPGLAPGPRRAAERDADLYRQAAEAGNGDAQYNLGCSYHDGRGVENDQAKANGTRPDDTMDLTDPRLTRNCNT